AIDVWMLSCMTFVFCSLLELAWVGYLSREEEYSPPPSAVALPTKTLPIPPLTSNKTTPVAPPTPSHQVHSATSTLHRTMAAKFPIVKVCWRKLVPVSYTVPKAIPLKAHPT
ncbi:hypothetical protein ANCDUO_22066, partial [Ancylostoma duodenale]